jgi:hypothetical protein
VSGRLTAPNGTVAGDGVASRSATTSQIAFKGQRERVRKGNREDPLQEDGKPVEGLKQ